MKKLIIAFVILLGAAAVYGFLVRGDAPIDGPQETIEQNEDGVRAALPGSQIVLPGPEAVRVTLTEREAENGTTQVVGEYTDPANPAIRGSVVIAGGSNQVPVTPSGEAGGIYYALVPFLANFGGSGTFLYVGLFGLDADGVLTHHDSLLVGDRVSLQTVQQSGQDFSVAYLDRAPGEALAAVPSIPAFIRFERSGEQLSVIAEYHNAAMDDIELTSPAAHETVTPTFTIAGQARGPWYFEATFSAEIRAANGESLLEVPVMTEAEWMTEDFVPFSEELTVADYTGAATLYLHKQNASGEPERAAWLAIPITIAE